MMDPQHLPVAEGLCPWKTALGPSGSATAESTCPVGLSPCKAPVPRPLPAHRQLGHKPQAPCLRWHLCFVRLPSLWAVEVVRRVLFSASDRSGNGDMEIPGENRPTERSATVGMFSICPGSPLGTWSMGVEQDRGAGVLLLFFFCILIKALETYWRASYYFQDWDQPRLF